MSISETARRRDRIVNLLSSYGELSTSALSDMLEVTVQTLRTDLRALDEARLVRRRHGGVTLATASENIDYQPRLTVSRDEKARIGAAMAKLIPNGSTVALGTGTTVEAVARALVGHVGLTVATNNIHVVMALRMAEDIKIMLAGGDVRLRDMDFIGAESREFFEGLQFDHAVFSVGGISETGDLLDFNLDEIRARQAISGCAQERTLVIDHAKCGRKAPHRWGQLHAMERVICGGKLPENLHRAAQETTCDILEV
ncbi:DeoR/GlpR family DNA-binding transcription regulator [Pacificibacter marinus]|uniref:Glycerol-3-phosphate regulon repressor n=1 Tax=Pacificibacter marinus TaxID=658057 RepID=A0A1Y5T537_9RHOB|nr:DeoR/GlpR family DNA-binding transcription regulator [Pacificibacter marinus]SEL21503.1 transcriptional regulator, DeoR family [Pacificibacter marinus]SLN56069.1 Glycerol-3-phosphate regulon repressor [Pacificibacter marinus]